MNYRWLVALYPEAWRLRYEEEFLALLEQCPLSLKNTLDLLLGALDAHLHPTADLGRMLPMLQRLRSSAITVFCAYIAFVLAGLGFWKMTENYVSRANTPPVNAMSYLAVEAGAIIALLAVLAGGLPIALVIVQRALAARQWRTLALFAVPPISLVVWLGYTFFLVVVIAPLRPHNFVLPGKLLALSLFGLFGLAAVVSTAAVVLAVRQVEAPVSLFRFARIPAAIATLAMGGMLIAATVWGLAAQVDLPRFFSENNGLLASNTTVSWTLHLAVMAIATVIAAVSVRRSFAAPPDASAAPTAAGQAFAE